MKIELSEKRAKVISPSRGETKELYLLTKGELRFVIIFTVSVTCAAIFAAALLFLAAKDFASGGTVGGSVVSVAIVKRAETVQAAPPKPCRKPPKPENDEAKINYAWLKKSGYDAGLAKKIAKEVRGVIDPRIAIAIAIKESSLGAAENGNNLFGVSRDEVGVSQGSDSEAIKNFIHILETCGYYDELSASDGLEEQIAAMAKWNTKNEGYFAGVKRLAGRLAKGEKWTRKQLGKS
jgi:hypothetical protein